MEGNKGGEIENKERESDEDVFDEEENKMSEKDGEVNGRGKLLTPPSSLALMKKSASFGDKESISTHLMDRRGSKVRVSCFFVAFGVSEHSRPLH